MIRGLNLGATDYVTKPFKRLELQSRVRAALRTSHLIRCLETKALIDPLTHIGNRVMFPERFSAEIALRIRSGSLLSLHQSKKNGRDRVSIASSEPPPRGLAA
jgi:PleD family two-component response regulator